MKKDDHKMKNDNFFEAWGNATNGIIYSATTQRNIRIQLVLAVIVMVLSLFYGLNTAEFLCLLFAVFMVIFAVTNSFKVAIITMNCSGFVCRCLSSKGKNFKRCCSWSGCVGSMQCFSGWIFYIF